MASEEKDATQRFIDLAWNGGRFDEARELLAPDFRNHTPFTDHETRDAFLARIAAFRAAFPDLHMYVDEMLQDGDRVITRWHAQGTHRGQFRDVAPTGRQVSFSGIAIDRVVGGRRVEGWAQLDLLGLLGQLR